MPPAPARTSEGGAPSPPRALQVIEIDNAKNAFRLREDLLKTVLAQCPAERKVALVSVVGAFRTGKSFLLDFFLRYLRLPQDEAGQVQWESLFSDGERLEGSINEELLAKEKAKAAPNSAKGEASTEEEQKTSPDADSTPAAAAPASGFSWRAGRETNTTGIWIWSEPFLRKLPRTGEEVAVLLIDTQGMFDQSLSQLLTTSIFGLSTLLSSYQVYNVKNQIQEDQLQHLSLFAEYGRVALRQDSTDRKGKAMAAAAAAGLTSDGSRGSASPTQKKRSVSTAEAAAAAENPAPFQTLQFLVRDWNEFEDLDDEALLDVKALEANMNEYLTGVLSSKGNEDLTSVRKHIRACFEKVDAFLLPHPGFAVVKKSYDGDFGKIRPSFKQLMRHYVHALFEERLDAKKINGQYVTASELFEYVRSYTAVFCEATAFPEPKTLLNAVADANNRNAFDKALRTHSRELKRFCGAGKDYRASEEIKAHHEASLSASLEQYDSKATYGPDTEIAKYRRRLRDECTLVLQEMLEINKERDPFRNLVIYTPMFAVAFGSYATRVVVDNMFCGWISQATTEFDWEVADVCVGFTRTLSFLYGTVFFFAMVAVAVKGHAGLNRLKDLAGAFSSVGKVAVATAKAKME